MVHWGFRAFPSHSSQDGFMEMHVECDWLTAGSSPGKCFVVGHQVGLFEDSQGKTCEVQSKIRNAPPIFSTCFFQTRVESESQCLTVASFYLPPPFRKII